MSTPPHPGPAAALDQPRPNDVPAELAAGGGPAAPRLARYGIHQVLWGIGGVITGLAVGVLGTGAESSSATAAARAPRPDRVPAARPTAAPKLALRGTTMAGVGLFVIGQNILPGRWHTVGAVGGSAGECFVELLHTVRTDSVITSETVTEPATITTTSRTRAIRTSGCRTWHHLAAAEPASTGQGGGGGQTGAGGDHSHRAVSTTWLIPALGRGRPRHPAGRSPAEVSRS